MLNDYGAIQYDVSNIAIAILDSWKSDNYKEINTKKEAMNESTNPIQK